MNNFDIVKFNELMNNGDLGALHYIKTHILDNMKEDLYKMNKVDYLKSLYAAVIELNTCVIVVEQCSNITNVNIHDTYSDLRELLFEELGIGYNYDYNEYYIKESE